MILCNSLLWSCEMTGKAGLTYQEAADSERAARKSLNAVPKEVSESRLCCGNKLPGIVGEGGLCDLVLYREEVSFYLLAFVCFDFIIMAAHYNDASCHNGLHHYGNH